MSIPTELELVKIKLTKRERAKAPDRYSDIVRVIVRPARVSHRAIGVTSSSNSRQRAGQGEEKITKVVFLAPERNHLLVNTTVTEYR
jgi:hypothetical protein